MPNTALVTRQWRGVRRTRLKRRPAAHQRQREADAATPKATPMRRARCATGVAGPPKEVAAPSAMAHALGLSQRSRAPPKNEIGARAAPEPDLGGPLVPI